jgi:hypothetical protein
MWFSVNGKLLISQKFIGMRSEVNKNPEKYFDSIAASKHYWQNTAMTLIHPLACYTVKMC